MVFQDNVPWGILFAGVGLPASVTSRAATASRLSYADVMKTHDFSDIHHPLIHAWVFNPNLLLVRQTTREVIVFN